MRDALALLRKKYHRNTFYFENPTFIDYAQMYINAYKAPKIKPSTLDFYKASLKILENLPIASRKIKDLKASDIMESLAKIKSDWQRDRTRGIIGMLLRQARAEDLMLKDLMVSVPPITKKRKKSTS